MDLKRESQSEDSWDKQKPVTIRVKPWITLNKRIYYSIYIHYPSCFHPFLSSWNILVLPTNKEPKNSSPCKRKSHLPNLHFVGFFSVFLGAEFSNLQIFLHPPGNNHTSPTRNGTFESMIIDPLPWPVKVGPSDSEICQGLVGCIGPPPQGHLQTLGNTVVLKNFLRDNDG